RPTATATASAITRPVRFMRLIPARVYPRRRASSNCETVEQLSRLWGLLAANVCFTDRRQPVTAFVAAGEHGDERDKQDDAAKAAGVRACSLRYHLHEPSQVGAPRRRPILGRIS